jgi:Na+/melibiose symporter-like transporter
MGAMIAYAAITNILLMTLYSMNNMPYSALGGVMTGDVNERAKLNSFRFVAVNIAQFIVGGFTLPLVAKFAAGHDRQYGWQMTMGIWAVLCLVLFFITFATTKERIQPVTQEKSSPKQDFAALLKNNPWKVMFFMTLVHFAILSFRGGALYNYYHHYADKAALFDWVASLHLTAAPLVAGAPAPGGILEWLGYIVHADRSDLANSNVADVANSLINMIGTGATIIIILLSPALSRKFGKKAIAVGGFALASIGSLAFYLLSPTNIAGMIALTVLIAIVYAPTIPLVWAIYADVADYSEWKTGRRFTGIVFATIGFALKLGLALGSSSFLWIMAGFFNYDPKQSDLPQAVEGYRACSSIVVGILFGVCTILLIAYQINKRMTIQMADELAERRKKITTA